MPSGAPTAPVQLRAHDWHLAVLPDLGGSVLALSYRDTAILRPVAGSPRHAIETGAYPLLPFVGRIEAGVFHSAKGQVRLPANLPGHTHPLHGQGWTRRWAVTDTRAASLTLEMDHPPGDWPWAYRATQTFRLAPAAFELDLTVENRDADAMPVGLGWHPFFAKGDARLTVPTTAIWHAPPGEIPASPQTLWPDIDLRTARQVDGLDLDHCFDVAPGPARIDLGAERPTLQLSSDEVFTKTVVFAPPQEDFFCVEPVTHAPNAVNMELPRAATGLIVLGPGERLTGTVRLAAQD